MTDVTTPHTKSFRMPSMSVLGPIIALIVLLVIGALMNSNFLSAANITNVLARSAFIGIIAVGMTFVITAGGLDLSVGSMAAFIAGLMILVMNAALPSLGVGVPIILLGMFTAIVAGLLAGLLNGFLITALGIEAFIVTLGSMGIYRSLVTWLADGGTLSLDFGLRSFYRPVYFDGILGISWPIIVFALVVIIGEIIMSRTVYGRHCAATGSNEHVAHYSNVNVNRTRLISYAALGILVGIATIIEGRFWPGLGHRHRRADPKPYRQYPEPYRFRVAIPQRGDPRDYHHSRCDPTARKEDGALSRS